ncbi:hydrolase 76 protein [Puccinia graminis f. sp. tritici]|uniref:Hydrolase 76 protein n=1 Tax=Puccinia graminis f. sp. tritici TaxID=56615 RepID=A0A5B0SEP4_PUCGR|nr:hydrolase 76 protein [Puccinia graminis f. sp. tritici]
MIGYNLLISFLGIYSVLGASYSPTLDISNTNQLVNAATSALKNLLTYYSGSDGSFDQADTPWHESGMIWGMFMDYAQYTGDTQFSGLVTSALVNSSFKTAHDFLGGNQGQVVEQFLGRWNDDVLWPNLVSTNFSLQWLCICWTSRLIRIDQSLKSKFVHHAKGR